MVANNATNRSEDGSKGRTCHKCGAPRPRASEHDIGHLTCEEWGKLYGGPCETCGSSAYPTTVNDPSMLGSLLSWVLGILILGMFATGISWLYRVEFHQERMRNFTLFLELTFMLLPTTFLLMFFAAKAITMCDSWMACRIERKAQKVAPPGDRSAPPSSTSGMESLDRYNQRHCVATGHSGIYNPHERLA